ncbi:MULTISPECIES: class I SAM-dependent methyltransferase [unclassified Kitasatospora]|uniref:class I SAM-dependent methyltransferase n=1 Tax=unclassified Kitasatospora TaxID=2633591 RepID=UPI00070A4CCB|nr:MULTISPECIES: class I SAM-dependent methyltransferase [unclassified Kitasatospora]KQV19332.1 methyltransferase type 11 [Kitasatospora sp. Root107]KRB63350.1 methyltransferase type 11 [Kitasatospora sp. Root187]
MPTLPLGRAPRPEDASHENRQVAESFGSDAERYDRARPMYPQALVDRIVAASPGRDVLDVGCGTGIVARQFEAAGCRVLGVDVDARMADLARQRGLDVEVAAFEAWDPAGREFDAVVSGQTWHWVDPVAGAATAAQALRPRGLLALFWNAGQPLPEVAEAFAEVYRRVMPDSLAARQWTVPAVDGYTALCTKAADGIREVDRFADPEQWRFDWERPYTRDEWLDQLPTQGAFTRLPQAKLEEVLAGVGAAIDAAGGSFTMHYATVAVTTLRTDTPSTAS